MQEYMNKMAKSIVLNKLHSKVHHVGWKIVSSVFRISYFKTKDLKEIYKQAREAYVIYLEYIEQTNIIDSEKGIDFTNVMTYIYKKVFGDAVFCGGDAINEMEFNNEFFDRMECVADVVVAWNEASFSALSREAFVNDYLQSYLLMFCDVTKCNLYVVFNLILEKNTDKLSCIFYSAFLKEFYLYIEMYSDRDFTKEYINELCLFRYYSDQEEFAVIFEKSKKNGDAKGFVKWFFSIN
jgi:hypothetical protein